MAKRILLYAAIYGGLGVAVGILMAIYTKDGDIKSIALRKFAPGQPTFNENNGVEAPVTPPVPTEVENE